MSTSPQPDTINSLIGGGVLSFAMLAGMQLGGFDPLGTGLLTAEGLAEFLGVAPDKLRRLLNALVASGLLEVEQGAYSNTLEAQRYLVRDSQDYMGDKHLTLAANWLRQLGTAESLRTGIPQSRTDYAGSSEEELEREYERMHPLTIRAGAELADRYDFSSYRRLADIGGGSGSLSIALTHACPNLEATVIDLSSNTPITQKYINRLGAADRVRVQGADVVAAAPEGSFDVAVLRWFLQVLTADQAVSALKNVSEAIEPGGKIFIWSGAVLDDSLVSPLQSLMFDLTAINRFDDVRAYTEREHREWLAAAGFEDVARDDLPDTQCIITAIKAS